MVNYLNNDHLKKPLFLFVLEQVLPFHSFIKSYKEINYQILHGVRYENEQYDKNVYSGNRYILAFQSIVMQKKHLELQII